MSDSVAATRVRRVGFDMPTQFRVESTSDISGALWPSPGLRNVLVTSRELAILLAAKSTAAAGSAIQVVHVASGEVIFRKG
jgi:hypothetical protein